MTNLKYLTVYGRKRGSKRFSPMDCNAGSLVVNRIHMTIFPLSARPQLVAYVEKLTEGSPDYEFEIREQGDRSDER